MRLAFLFNCLLNRKKKIKITIILTDSFQLKKLVVQSGLSKTALSVYLRVMSGSWTVKLESLSQRRLRRQRERHKINRFRLAKQQLCTCIKLICTFLCRHCTTTTWKCLISCFVDDVNSRQRLSFSFPELSYSLLEFNSSKICQHLTNWMSWNKRDKCLK